MLKVEDVMLNRPPLLSCEQGLSVAVDMIIKSGYLGLPVIDADKHLVGFLSEQDCIKELIRDSYYCDSHTLVKDVMRESPLFVSPHLSVLEFAQSLGQGKPKIFPVVEDNQVVGLVTRGQAMKSLSQSLQSCKVT